MQTIVKNIDGWGSPLGFSATNMRYVTITKSRFYNNAVGIAPNALDSEKFPPAEGNVIIDNDIFWNNFNFHQGNPPFAVRDDRRGGARTDRHGHPAARRPRQPGREQPHLRQLPDRRRRDRGDPAGEDPGRRHAREQRHPRQPVRPRRHRPNGSDIAYDGNGTNNCFTLRRRDLDVPGRPLDVRRLRRRERLQQARRRTRCSAWTGEGALDAWKKHAHPAKPGYTPLEVFNP